MNVFERAVLTRRQRQDELVKMCPGSARVIHRPNTNPDGSEIVTNTDYEFPAWICEDYVKGLCEVCELYQPTYLTPSIFNVLMVFWHWLQAMRLSLLERDEFEVRFFRNQLQRFCGIQVDLNGADINNNSGSATP